MSVLSQSISNAYLNSRRPGVPPGLGSGLSSGSGVIRNGMSISNSSPLTRSNTGLVYCEGKNASSVDSQVERAIIESENPLPLHGHEEIVVNDTRGTWLNKEENMSWTGPIPLDQYRVNNDPNPTLITKKPTEKVKYKQEVHVKYLKPPTPKPSELIIVQEPHRQLPPAPPLIIRQAAPRQPTPEPIIIREAPPLIPEPIRRVIHVPGKLLPPPARKVIVERLPCEPPKPQQIIIERWLKPEIPPPRVIVCKPIERPPIVYDVIETRCDIPTPAPMQCPPGCQPICQPQCPPGCQPIMQQFHHQQQQQQQQQHQINLQQQQISIQQQQQHCISLEDKNDIVISIFIE